METQTTQRPLDAERFQVYGSKDFDHIPQLQRLSPSTRFEMRVVSEVLPFRINRYVIEHLIDWDNVPDDPLFQLTFPQREMLSPQHFECVASALVGKDRNQLSQIVSEIHSVLNPHPAQQEKLNTPTLDGHPVPGLQHKYRDTVLIFPREGQTCHSYCTFCFRWAQFVRNRQLRIATSERARVFEYLRRHAEVSDVLITGGDPLVMRTNRLADYLLPLLAPEFEHIRSIRIGTKALSFWPFRLLTDSDSVQLLELLEKLVEAGKHVAIMSHFDHWRELEGTPVRDAIRRLRSTGAVIRSQGPLLAHVNASAETLGRLWNTQVQLGITPYYLFVERDTGARRYFEVPIARVFRIYTDALKSVSGLGRTARGPVMSTGPGKVQVQGVAEISKHKVFVLSFLQARQPDWIGRTFFAEYDPEATWFSQLKPFEQDRFFFQDEYNRLIAETA